MQSHIQDNQYFTSYTIEPMLELLWSEDATHEDTRYKVILPIKTPLQSQLPQVIDSEYLVICLFLICVARCLHSSIAPTDTISQERRFKVLFGPFGHDVALVNITFPSEVLSVADCTVRGFNILEHMSPNSSSKVFTLEVPFTDRVVQQMVSFTLNSGKLVYFNFLL